MSVTGALIEPCGCRETSHASVCGKQVHNRHLDAVADHTRAGRDLPATSLFCLLTPGLKASINSPLICLNCAVIIGLKIKAPAEYMGKHQ